MSGTNQHVSKLGGCTHRPRYPGASSPAAVEAAMRELLAETERQLREVGEDPERWREANELTAREARR